MQATSSTFSETAPLKNSWSTVYGNVRQTMQIRLRCLCSGLVQAVCRLFNGRFYAWPWDKMAARSCPFEALIIPYGIAWGNIKARSPSISLTFLPERLPSKCPPALAKEKKACIASTDDVTLDNFIDCIRRCAISRIIEVPQLGIWSAAGGECCAWSWGISIETDRCIWAPTVKWPCPEDIVLVIKW